MNFSDPQSIIVSGNWRWSMTTCHEKTDFANSIELQSRSLQHTTPIKETSEATDAPVKLENSENAGRDGTPAELPPPITEPLELQRWNHPRLNMWRCFACFMGMLIMGANDAAYGVRNNICYRVDCADTTRP